MYNTKHKKCQQHNDSTEKGQSYLLITEGVYRVFSPFEHRDVKR